MNRLLRGGDIPGVVTTDEAEQRCHACGEEIVGEVPGHGLLIWVRGDDVLREEPPLCARCGLAVSMTARSRWEIEEEEG